MFANGIRHFVLEEPDDNGSQWEQNNPNNCHCNRVNDNNLSLSVLRRKRFQYPLTFRKAPQLFTTGRWLAGDRRRRRRGGLSILQVEREFPMVNMLRERTTRIGWAGRWRIAVCIHKIGSRRLDVKLARRPGGAITAF